jgi:hypothetical protein
MQAPFLLYVSQPTSEGSDTHSRDFPTTEDPLPAAVDLTAGGYVLARDTQITAAKTETTDDK